MKKIIFLFITFTILFFNAKAQTSGGPDAYGYIWRNNFDAQGPAYNWIDISTKGNTISGLGDDNVVGPFSIGFAFHYYWNDNDQVWIGSNGYLIFQGGINLASPFPAIIPDQNDGKHNFIAGMLCDLFPLASTGAKVYTWTNNTDTFIMQFDSVPFWYQAAPGYTGRNTFQIILSGSDSSITFQYKFQTGFTYNNDLKTGIENITGTVGLQVLSNTYPAVNTAVKFYYPDSVTYQVFDVKPTWNQNSGNGGFFVIDNGPGITLQTLVSNAGNQNITVPFDILAIIYNPSFTVIFRDTVTLDSLAQEKDTLLTFPDIFMPSGQGSHTFTTVTMLSSDMNNSNNQKSIEIVVTDTSVVPTELKYDQGAASGNISWLGGGGAGVYFAPPYYPVTAVALKYFSTNYPQTYSSPTAGFTATVRDDDGPDSSPGTLLYTGYFPGGIFLYDVFTLIGIPLPFTIDSGGIYVGWESFDDSIGIGTDNSVPVSAQTYEILNGNWAIYRSRATEEIMIRCLVEPAPLTSVCNHPVSKFETEVFPSPAAGTAFLLVTTGANPGKYEITLNGIAGNRVKKTMLYIPEAGRVVFPLSLSGIPAGVYFITLSASTGQVAVKKFVVTE